MSQLNFKNGTTHERLQQLTCCGINHKAYTELKIEKLQWHCSNCLTSTNNIINFTLTANVDCLNSNHRKKVKCGYCRKNIPEHLRIIDSHKTGS